MPVSADRPDWTREHKRFWEWQPSRSLLASLRAYQRVRGSRRPDHVARRWVAVVRHRFWSVVTGADIPLNCQIGGGLLMPHPNGIVVHPAAVIGPNCLLFQQVTIGSRGGPAPRLGGHVDVGAGAKVLGDLVVGANARIGANSVVLADVPAGDTVVGMPARSVRAPQPASPGFDGLPFGPATTELAALMHEMRAGAEFPPGLRPPARPLGAASVAPSEH